MDLTQCFVSQGWKVKYNLHKSHSADRTVVFVHGTPWSSKVFEPMVRALVSTQRHSILIYDLAGYGVSQEFDGQSTSSKSKFTGDTSVKTQAVILAELLAHLELDGKEGRTTPQVIAHDIAGTIALRTHLIHHCEFRSLLLMDTNTVLPWGDGFYKLVRSEPEVFMKLPHGIFESVVRAVIRSAVHSPGKLLSGWEDDLARPWVASQHDGSSTGEGKQRNFIRQIAQANDADVAEMLDADMYANVRCDVKILWGEQDQWIPREKVEALARKMSRCVRGFVVIPEAGHLLMIDQPERVALESFEWLEQYR